MQTQIIRVRVFVASPGDVQSERDALSEVINELNLTLSTLAPEKGIVIELLRWETHAFPEMGRVQGIINDQIGLYDVFVGIMWKRFGTPTGISESGTEEEFELAYAQWEKTKKIPHIMFYFCQAPSAPPKSKEDAEQLAKVVAFRSRLSEKGLVWEYQNHSSFADTIRPHLIQVLGKLFPVSESAKEIAQKVGSLALDSEVPVVQKQALELAQEYEQIRATMPSGNARTRKMEAVMTQMKNLAPMIYPLLQSFSESASPGQRLVATAILQGIPTPEYLSWLADRLAKDRPFIGYHAAVALLIAVRTLHFSHFDILAQAIQDARNALGEQYQHTDRGRILKNAEEELAIYR